MSERKSTGSTRKKRSDSSFLVLSEDHGFETDLEDDPDIWYEERESKLTKTTTQRYFEACESLGTVPVTRFLRECQAGVVDLKHYGIRDIGAQAIARALEQDIVVTNLCLHDNGIEETGSVALSRALKDNCFVTNFDLSENKLGKEGACAIGEMLLENASLQELNLSGCGVHGKDIKLFLDALSFNPHLRSLDFSYNDLGDEGAIYLGRALQKNEKLESLDLSWNNIRVTGIEELANGLAKNKSLRELDLAWNCFSDEGANYLSCALVQNDCLEVLEMQSCGIHTAGALRIAEALKLNQTMEVLRVGKNSFQSSGVCSLLRGLRYNCTSALRELVLEDMVFDKDCEVELDALLEERPNFTCSWGVSIRGGDVKKGVKKPDTMELFLTFVRTKGLRLVDLFRIISKDGNASTINKNEFITGMKKLNVPLKDHQLRALFDSLDINGDESVEFHEFLGLRSHYLKTRRGNALI
ncbi:leucine-rich repeat-containing protein 74B-like [Acropora millepora]|uniref:leucine-rich repeat-containing protein 74B-like n=1 Tax=Acropora millepora TaxID=45264 RepID=UPI001CF5464D|nr:leucine-rich repeat-containing protein 74B-like [Acropora millepora]